MNLVHKYQTQRALQHERAVDDPTREKEIKYYVCSVFVHYWFLKDLDQTLDLSFGVFEAVSRADIAEAQGYWALKLIVAFLKEKQDGGLDLVK